MKRFREAQAPQAKALAKRRKGQWPDGATAGLLLIAGACFGLSMTLYQIAGPRDVFAESGPQ